MRKKPENWVSIRYADYLLIRSMSDVERLSLWDAILDYGFTGAKPKKLSFDCALIFELVRLFMAACNNVITEDEYRMYLYDENVPEEVVRLVREKLKAHDGFC